MLKLGVTMNKGICVKQPRRPAFCQTLLVFAFLTGACGSDDDDSSSDASAGTNAGENHAGNGAGAGGAGGGDASIAGDGGTSGTTGGAGGTGGAMTYEVSFQSCSDMAGDECQGESCCTTLDVPAGSFPMGRGTELCSDCADGCPASADCRSYELPEHPASVNGFSLDKYEVTVGRFRKFVEQYDGTPPKEGAGAHPQIAGSGWQSAWNERLLSGRGQLINELRCDIFSYTWTDAPEDNETLPITCPSWYEAFAFCIWDGGRLPTEAEWEYAAAGGDENRLYPWGSAPADGTLAVYYCLGDESQPSDCGLSSILPVGSRPLGNGRWGHSDLAGSAEEWTLDWWSELYYADKQSGCSDCANISGGESRVLRGGLWYSEASGIRSAARNGGDPSYHLYNNGFRCAR